LSNGIGLTISNNEDFGAVSEMWFWRVFQVFVSATDQTGFSNGESTQAFAFGKRGEIFSSLLIVSKDEDEETDRFRQSPLL